MTSGRRGVSLPEVLVALTLGVFVVHMGWSTIRGLERFEEHARGRGDTVLAARVVRSVLRGELAHGVAGRDWWVTADSLSLRAFRGTAVVCGPSADSTGALLVAYAGDRRPEPAKDSVELVGSDGSIAYFDLLTASDALDPCVLAVAGEVVMRWVVDGPLRDRWVAARVFERGGYHLTGSALRYRSGAGGRQPLTPEVWDDRDTGWRLDPASVSVSLRPTRGHGEVWGGFFAWIDGT